MTILILVLSACLNADGESHDDRIAAIRQLPPMHFEIYSPEEVIDAIGRELSRVPPPPTEEQIALYERRAAAYAKIDKMTLALADLDARILIRPVPTEVLLKYALWLHVQKNEKLSSILNLLELSDPKCTDFLAMKAAMMLERSPVSAKQIALSIDSNLGETSYRYHAFWAFLGAYSHEFPLLDALQHSNTILLRFPSKVSSADYKSRGLLQLRLGNVQAAWNDLEIASRDHPESIGIAFLIWLCAERLRLPANALLLAEKMDSLPHTSSLPESLIGISMIGQHNASGARLILEKSIARYPRGVDARCALGQLEEHEGNVESAIQHYQQAHKLSPSDRNTCIRLARLLLIKGKTKDANQLLENMQECRLTDSEIRKLILLAIANRFSENPPATASDEISKICNASKNKDLSEVYGLFRAIPEMTESDIHEILEGTTIFRPTFYYE